jgi:hypothetical protein
MKTDKTYGAIERQLQDNNFEVLHLMRDTRGDWGDDGGYIVSMSKKNDIVYLHIIQVNYNLTIHENILDEEQWEESTHPDSYPDFFAFSSVEDAQLKLNEFVKYLNKAVWLEEEMQNYYFKAGYIEKDWEIPDGFQHLDNQYLSMIAICVNAYGDYMTQDQEKLLNLSKTPYVPDFSDDY